MSVIHINQIANKIRGKFEIFLDKTGISGTGDNIDNMIKTRCLAAFAIYNALQFTPEEAANSVIDGADDNGIDAIAYSSVQKKMVIVQSKWSNKGNGEPNSQDINTLCSGVKDLFNWNFERFNEKLQNKIESLKMGMEEFDTKYEVVLIDTYGASELAIHAQRKIDDLKIEMNDTGDPDLENILEFTRINQNKIYTLLANGDKLEPINIELSLQNYGYIEQPYKAYYGCVSGEEIGKLWIDFGTRLFDDNLRQVLGLTDVNEEIENTIKLNPEKFWYFNNGITMIAENIKKNMTGGSSRDFGVFQLGGISVINGAQTLSTIGKYLKKNKSIGEDVKVNLRVISLGENGQELKKEITKANNRQNRIENRDFLSQEETQLRLKLELRMENIDYNIMRSEYFTPSDRSFDLMEATVALACASDNVNLAVNAKRGIGKFYDDLSSKGLYVKIFNPATSGIYLYNCVKLNRIIEISIANHIKKLDKKSGKEYGVLIHGNRIISLLVMREYMIKEKGTLIDFEIESSLIDNLVEEKQIAIKKFIDKKYKDNVLGTFFKNTTKCLDLVMALK